MASEDKPTRGHETDSAAREAQDIWGWARQITAGAPILPTKTPANPQETKGGGPVPNIKC